MYIHCVCNKVHHYSCVVMCFYFQSDITIPFCPDVDECSDENGGCSQICTNAEGSFLCECTTGYLLDSDGATCNGEYYMKH